MDSIHVTVAAIIKRNGRYLLVKERASSGDIVFNQPAGHVELNESLEEAVIREVDEETGLPFKPTALLGTYLLSPASNGKTYLRFCFIGEAPETIEPAPKDPEILANQWFELDEILNMPEKSLRSALVLQCIQDECAGRRLPLESLNFSADEPQLSASCSSNLKQHLHS